MILGLYRHYKGGSYEVLGIVTNSETEEDMVLYKSESGHLWVRPSVSFFGQVVKDGVLVPRFEAIPAFVTSTYHEDGDPVKEANRRAKESLNNLRYPERVEQAERRAVPRVKCDLGGCNLVPGHAGSHRGACGCLSGCKAWECPNL